MFIRTERLFLRPVFAEDWSAIHEAMADGSIARMLARAPWPYVEQDAVQFCASAADRAPYDFAITLPDAPGAPHIGQVGLVPVLPGRGGPYSGDRAFELGFWIAPDWQGRGYAGEAVAGLIHTARALGVRRIVAGHFLDNPGSARVLQRAGLVPTGEVRPTASSARSGEPVLARRYALDLDPAPATCTLLVG